MEDTQVITTNTRTKVLSNGAVYDLDKKRIVANPGGGTTAITSEKASEFHARRQELKRQRIIAGAAKVLERVGDWEKPDDLDVVEAIGEAVMEKALDVDSKGQIAAAQFILTEAGLSAAQARREDAGGGENSISGSPEALMRLVELLEAERSAAVDRARAIDVTATDTDE
jgi:hypothetical protein